MRRIVQTQKLRENGVGAHLESELCGLDGSDVATRTTTKYNHVVFVCLKQ